jgi:hypothetical protein
MSAAGVALVLLVPAALLTWRWSRLVSGALWLTLATWLAYRGLHWTYPDAWAAGHFEWMRGVSMVTGLVGGVELTRLALLRDITSPSRGGFIGRPLGRPDILAGMLMASMGVDLTAWLIHRGAGQWGPQPFFQVVVLLAMCGVSAWPRRKS